MIEHLIALKRLLRKGICGAWSLKASGTVSFISLPVAGRPVAAAILRAAAGGLLLFPESPGRIRILLAVRRRCKKRMSMAKERVPSAAESRLPAEYGHGFRCALRRRKSDHLAEIKSIIGIKDSAGDMPNTEEDLCRTRRITQSMLFRRNVS